MLPCDQYHHYYHYQASQYYLWLAETLRVMGRQEDAIAAYDKALFQDHQNQEALAGKACVVSKVVRIFCYQNHPTFDHEFCQRIGMKTTTATDLHDQAVHFFEAGDYVQVKLLCDAAIASDPEHSNSYFLQGKNAFMKEDYDEAVMHFLEAIRLAHELHQAYHYYASMRHIERGKEFFEQQNYDLAIADFSKALDLFARNEEAHTLRAKTYRAKGNDAMADEDERYAARLRAS